MMPLMKSLDYVVQRPPALDDDGDAVLVGQSFDSTAAVVTWPGMGSAHGLVEALHYVPVEKRVLKMSSHIH
jgi:hypothetical protein